MEVAVHQSIVMINLRLRDIKHEIELKFNLHKLNQTVPDFIIHTQHTNYVILLVKQFKEIPLK